MKSSKNFDSVKMKNDIQAQLLKEQQGRSDTEIRMAIQKKLETSKNPIAQFWRKLQKKDARKAA